MPTLISLRRMLWMITLLSACTAPSDRADPPASADPDAAAPPAALPPAAHTPAPTDALPPDADTAASLEPPDSARAIQNARWTVGVTDIDRNDAVAATLRAVRTASHADYDRIVFDFGNDPLPGYHVEYIDRPVRQCGSGDVVPLAGDAWLQIRTEPAYAHTDAGQPTIRDRARAPALPNLKELKLTCDFEAQVEWVAGVASPNPYRVLELRAPTRLVVDIRHRR